MPYLNLFRFMTFFFFFSKSARKFYAIANKYKKRGEINKDIIYLFYLQEKKKVYGPHDSMMIIKSKN